MIYFSSVGFFYTFKLIIENFIKFNFKLHTRKEKKEENEN